MSELQRILESEATDVARLSSRSGLAMDRLRALAQGAEPTLKELRLLADALRVPIVEFAPRSAHEREADLLLRRAPVSGRPVQGIALSALSRRIASSADLLRGSARGYGPWWFTEFRREDNSFESAEHNAAVFRSLFYNDDHLSPICSLPSVAVERMGVMVFVIRSSDIDGASAYFDGIPFVFVSTRFPPRMLFTLAHEIGHLVAHHDARESFAVVDETTDPEGLQGVRKGPEELYADAFASALLLPPAGVGVALKKVREATNVSGDQIGDLEIAYLARIFGVSFWAAARRCEDLKLLPRGGAASFNEKLIREFGSAEKRADEVGLPPRREIQFPAVPQPLLLSVVESIRAGDMSIGRGAAILGLSISDLMAANSPTAH